MTLAISREMWYNQVNIAYREAEIMELGKRMKAARLEAGLSQRQLCGERITRNMLSQIENGAARPSMDTLLYLADRLGKPMAYFLDEDPVVSPNRPVMERGREALASGGPLLDALDGFQEPDPVYDPEYRVLRWLGLVQSAEEAADTGREIYARELLHQAEALESLPPLAALPELARRRLALLCRVEDPAKLSFPDQDEELILRARAAKDASRAAALLDACENRESPRWNLYRGKCCLEAGDWAGGEACLRKAEGVFPKETAPLLERCCMEQGDFKGAYLYACRQREFQ